MARLQDIDIPYLEFAEAAAPGTPAAAVSRLYVKADGLFYSKDDAGVETLVSGGAGGGSVATDAIWDVAGDTVVGTGANTAARLAIGAAGGALSRVNGAVAWNSGTANPTATTGDRYWRTDLGLEIYYDGTRWLTTTLYMQPYSVGDAVLPTATTGTVVGRMTPWHSTYDLWLDTFYCSTFVGTTNNGTNYWTVNAVKYTAAAAATTFATFNTSAHTVSNFVTTATAIGALLATTSKHMTLEVAKTLAPGSIYASGSLAYRLVVT